MTTAIAGSVWVRQDVMAEELLDPPSFADDGASVTVRLPLRGPSSAAIRAGDLNAGGIARARCGLPYSLRQLHEHVIGLAQTRPNSNADVRDLTGLDRPQGSHRPNGCWGSSASSAPVHAGAPATERRNESVLARWEHRTTPLINHAYRGAVLRRDDDGGV